MTEYTPAETASPVSPAEQPAAASSRQSLDRVREILLGSDMPRPQRAEVERLRDILFGPEIERYERRLGDLARQVEQLGSDLQRAQERDAESERVAARRFETVESDAKRTEYSLQRALDRQTSQDEVVRQLVGQESQHQLAVQSINGQIADIRRQVQQIDQDLRALKLNVAERFDLQERANQALRRDMRQSLDELRTELRRHNERLDDQKTDRKALASMLIEVAARLQSGSTVTSLLEGLSPSEG